VDDLAGLLADLKAKSFAVLNVASDARGTYVYLDDAEEKDPVPVILEWVGRPAPKPNSRAWKARVKEAMALASGKPPSLFSRIRGFFSRRKTVELPTATELPPENPPSTMDPKFFRKIL
jgi:hypothetical protein